MASNAGGRRSQPRILSSAPNQPSTAKITAIGMALLNIVAVVSLRGLHAEAE